MDKKIDAFKQELNRVYKNNKTIIKKCKNRI